ncbi:MAG: aminopeptidase P N-terminal domain-containing protein [Bacilli bacterium]|nr:aminopeptidase P N-terminal domain-containing protein [Bacilli bacterium]
MSELGNRRFKLVEKMKANSAAIIFSGVSKIASEDELYPFQVNNNFFYLTGIEQEHSVLLIVKGFSEVKTYLFVDEYSELKEKWTGRRLTLDEAKQISDIDNVYTYNQLDSMISVVFDDNNNQYGKIDACYFDLSPEIKVGDELSIKQYVEKFRVTYPNIGVIDVYPLIRDLRMIKSRYEVECIVKAIEETGKGINNTLKKCNEGIYEYELAEIFNHYGMMHGRRKLAFSTIVAAGKNATCLHYPGQNSKIKNKDMVLFDLGYKEAGYSADISRTYPVNGVFAGIAKSVYEAVLNCNKSVIEYARTGMTIADLQAHAIEVLTSECLRLKLINKDDDIKKYYYHNVSHHLGLDTHDISIRERPLENGNVITVEPGLYFANFGVGVRIEDDILFKDGKAVVLSKGIAKEIADVERLMASKKFEE